MRRDLVKTLQSMFYKIKPFNNDLKTTIDKGPGNTK